jgi:hypothetical protein
MRERLPSLPSVLPKSKALEYVADLDKLILAIGN